MPDWAVDNIVRTQFRWWHTDSASWFYNNLYWRVRDGLIPQSAAGVQSIIDALTVAGGLIAKWRPCVSDKVYLKAIATQGIVPAGPVYYTDFLAATYPGSQGGSVEDQPSIGACLVKKNFLAGRRGIGRTFVGPITPAYFVNGIFVPTADYTGLASQMMQELNITGPAHLRPIVCPANGVGVTSQNDLREVVWSRIASSLRSRRPTIGI